MKHFNPLPWLLSLVLSLSVVHSVAALEPDELALIVNSNEPAGAQLAKLYAEQRHVPENRILSLDLPTTDDMPNRQYEEQVIPQVREFLRAGKLEGKVKCLVTFYGVPLRIAGRINTPAEAKEVDELRLELSKLPDRIQPSIQAVEALAVQLNPGFKPVIANDLDSLLRRQNLAIAEISSQLRTIPGAAAQVQWAVKFFDAAEPLLGDYGRINKMAAFATTRPTNTHDIEVAKNAYNKNIKDAGGWEETPASPDARAKLRQVGVGSFGLLQYTQIIRDQIDYLSPEQSGSAFDNELAMVRWLAYPHKGWFANPLNPMLNPPTNRAPARMQTLMVSRLDAPNVETVKSLIAQSIKVEQNGLTGKVVIDSLGVKLGEEKPDQHGYGQYDQYLRDLNTLLTEHTKLQVVLDEKPEVLPPNSVDGVALYVGWYSVHNYVGCCKFVPGAVGYHIASYELQSLRKPNETGWVRGLLLDGAVGTLGPVAEPFLGSFPHPDEYFPLLLTGKLTLAEVYWKTQPTVSWMMTCVGDPLYNPYKNNPVLKPADLPVRLRAALTQSTP